MNKNSRLSKKEQLFCIYYADCFDATLAAKKAGFVDDSEKAGLVMLCDSKIIQRIVEVLKNHEKIVKHMTATAVQKLSLQGVSDAVRLLYMDKPSVQELESMKLLNISEIKKLKDGAMEIKFFDRLKSINCVAMSNDNDNSGVNSLVQALCMGAQNLNKCESAENGI